MYTGQEDWCSWAYAACGRPTLHLETDSRKFADICGIVSSRTCPPAYCIVSLPAFCSPRCPRHTKPQGKLRGVHACCCEPRSPCLCIGGPHHALSQAPTAGQQSTGPPVNSAPEEPSGRPSGGPMLRMGHLSTPRTRPHAQRTPCLGTGIMVCVGGAAAGVQLP